MEYVGGFFVDLPTGSQDGGMEWCILDRVMLISVLFRQKHTVNYVSYLAGYGQEAWLWGVRNMSGGHGDG